MPTLSDGDNWANVCELTGFDVPFVLSSSSLYHPPYQIHPRFLSTTSGSPKSDGGVEALELDAHIIGGDPPLDRRAVADAFSCPCRDVPLLE